MTTPVRNCTISPSTSNLRQPLRNEGRIKPIIDSRFPLEQVRQAHERMESNLNFGKIVLTVEE